MEGIFYIFWTGGWDSTFMLIQELKKGKTIQPIYIVDSERNGRFKEIEAMNFIIRMLKQEKFLGGNILPIIEINREDIVVSNEEKEAFSNILKVVRLGSQYEWLAPISKKYGNISMGIEKPNGEFNGCVDAINKLGAFRYEDDCGYIDSEKSNNDIKEIFGNINFPIVTLTENDMLEKVKEWNVEPIMQHIWFCHSPLNGRPCGVCRPCQQKMECNMQFLLPEKSQKRYFFFHKLGKFPMRATAKVIKTLNKTNS